MTIDGSAPNWLTQSTWLRIDDLMLAGLIFVGQKRAAERRLDAEDVEIVAPRHAPPRSCTGSLAAGERRRCRRSGPP